MREKVPQCWIGWWGVWSICPLIQGFAAAGWNHSADMYHAKLFSLLHCLELAFSHWARNEASWWFDRLRANEVLYKIKHSFPTAKLAFVPRAAATWEPAQIDSMAATRPQLEIVKWSHLHHSDRSASNRRCSQITDHSLPTRIKNIVNNPTPLIDLTSLISSYQWSNFLKINSFGYSELKSMMFRLPIVIVGGFFFTLEAKRSWVGFRIQLHAPVCDPLYALQLQFSEFPICKIPWQSISTNSHSL